MNEARKSRVLSIRTGEDIISYIDDFRRAQLATPTQTEALKTLVRLGFDKWKDERAAVAAK